MNDLQAPQTGSRHPDTAAQQDMLARFQHALETMAPTELQDWLLQACQDWLSRTRAQRLRLLATEQLLDLLIRAQHDTRQGA